MKKKIGLVVLFFVAPFTLFWASFQLHHRPELEKKLDALCATVFDTEPGLENVHVSFQNSARDAVLVGSVATRADLERAESLLLQKLEEERTMFAGVRGIGKNLIEVEDEIRRAQVASATKSGPTSKVPAIEDSIPVAKPVAETTTGPDPNLAHGTKPDTPPESPVPPTPKPEPPSGPGASGLEVIAGKESIVLKGRLAGEGIEKELISSAITNQRGRDLMRDELFVVPETGTGAWEKEIFLVLNLLLEATLECRLQASGADFELSGIAENDLTHGALLALCKDLESKEFKVTQQFEIAPSPDVPSGEEPDVMPAKRVNEAKASDEAASDAPSSKEGALTSSVPPSVDPVPDAAFLADMKAATVYFSSGVSKLNEEEIKRLAKVADGMKKIPGFTLTIAGFGDADGDPEVNKKMTLKRANAVKSALVEGGLDPKRTEVVDKGAGKPVGKRSGRRVELSIRK